MNTESAILFLALVAVTLYITYWAGKRNKSVETHLVAKGAIAGRQNGVAIAGDFISAATSLGTTGAIALGGFNGLYLAVYTPISYLLCLLLVAEPLPNLGHFTLGDVLASRFHGDGVRARSPPPRSWSRCCTSSPSSWVRRCCCSCCSG